MAEKVEGKRQSFGGDGSESVEITGGGGYETTNSHEGIGDDEDGAPGNNASITIKFVEETEEVQERDSSDDGETTRRRGGGCGGAGGGDRKRRRRKECEGGGISKKRKSYTNSFKLEAVELAEKIGNRPAAKKLGLEESNIRDWRKRKGELEKMPGYKMTKRHAKPKWIKLETTLAEWFLDRQSRKLYVTTNMVKEKGMEIAAKMGHLDFSGSSGWVARFMSRMRDSGRNAQKMLKNPCKSDHYSNAAEMKNEYASNNVNNKESDESYSQLPSPVSHCDPIPEESSHPLELPQEMTDKALEFRTKFVEKRAQYESKRRNSIIVLDEVPMSLEMPVEHHVAFSANELNSDMELTHIIPTPEKFQFTVVLSASAAGGKLPPLVIFKGHALPEEVTSSLTGGILARANNVGWIEPNLIDDWIENSWKKWLWPLQHSDENLLILDSCETHLSSEIKLRCSKYFQLYYIPEGMGEYLNPLEISVIKSFKQNLIKQWEQELLNRAYGASNDEDGDQRLTIQMRNYMTICRWVLGAWKDVNPQVIMNGFAKSGIESFSPEDVVEAILNDRTNHVEADAHCIDATTVHTGEDYVGDKFNGWY